MGSITRDIGVFALGTVGTVLAAVHAAHFLAASTTLSTVVETGVPLGLSAAIVPAAAWIRRWDPTTREFTRVWAWIFVGVLAMLAVTIWTVGYDLVTGLSDVRLQRVVANNVTAGVVLGVVLGVYDVTNRRRERAYGEARGTLQRERDRFASLFEGVPNPTVFYEYVDGEPVVLDVNPAFEAVFGYTECEIVGESLDEHVVPPNDREEAARLNERLAEEDLQVSVTRQTEGEPREFLLYTVPLASDRSRGFATYVDISDQRRSEQRLQVLNRVLRHDLRNAMNVVIGHADNLAADDSAVDDGVAVAAIRNRAEDLLSKSRKAREVEHLLEAEGAPRETIDVAGVAVARVAAVEDAYPELDVDVEVPDEPVWAVANETLSVAVENVLENAATHGGGDVTLVVEDVDPVTLTVRDKGPGIPESEIEVLAREEETQLEHTSGLGLWIATWIVRDAGGDVRIVNRADGAEVTLELPAVDSAPSDDRTD